MSPAPPSPQERAPSSDLPAATYDRRLIVISVREGEDVEVDFDGDFAWWELTAALNRALDLIEEEQHSAADDEEE